MYAFKTERPDAARRYHNKFVTGTNYQEESNRRFALSEPSENILRTSILESGWLIKNITLRDVNAVSGNAVNIGASELHPLEPVFPPPSGLPPMSVETPVVALPAI